MASSAQSIPNLSSFSQGELTSMLNAVKAEMLVRITGRVQTGSSTQQSFGVNMMDTDALYRLNNALVDMLGLDGQETRVRPCFSRQGIGAEVDPLLDGRTTL